jgi:environmental stress-induced protein Ves
MNWQHIALADATPLPWKNGGGTTRELLAWPPGVADWHWRISVAQVEADGPFSRFDGVQRWFAVLDGEGVELALGQGPKVQTQRLTRQSAVFGFDGAQSVDCKLINGPTQDFNLMVRSVHASAKLQRVREAMEVRARESGICAVWAGASGAMLRDANGSWPLPAHTLAWTQIVKEQSVYIDSADALYMEIAPCL